MIALWLLGCAGNGGPADDTGAELRGGPSGSTLLSCPERGCPTVIAGGGGWDPAELYFAPDTTGGLWAVANSNTLTPMAVNGTAPDTTNGRTILAHVADNGLLASIVGIPSNGYVRFAVGPTEAPVLRLQLDDPSDYPGVDATWPVVVAQPDPTTGAFRWWLPVSGNQGTNPTAMVSAPEGLYLAGVGGELGGTAMTGNWLVLLDDAQDVIGSWDTGAVVVTAVAPADDGAWVAGAEGEAPRLGRLSGATVAFQPLETQATPVALAVQPAGEALWVADGHGVWRLDPDGHATAAFGRPVAGWLKGLAMDSSGNAFAAYDYERRPDGQPYGSVHVLHVQHLGAEGYLAEIRETEGPLAAGITSSADSVWVNTESQWVRYAAPAQP